MLVLALTLAAEAPAAARMYLGFHDDVTFRWSPSRQANLDDARAAHVSVVRTLAQWAEIATRRPANARNPFDPAYNFGDLDELTQNTSARGIQLLIVIWGTPGWANGSRGTNHAPAKLSDLRDFARALAARYSGRYPGLPRVRMFSVWNEPNLNQFLAPQFDGRGRSVAPALYAKLYRAARAGLKAGNSAAQVAIGETSPRGKDRPGSKVQSSHSPVRFAQLLAAADRRIPFDAWGAGCAPSRSAARNGRRCRSRTSHGSSACSTASFGAG